MALGGIGAVLEAARTSAGLTQRALAERAGTAQSLVARIERGRANPTVATLERLLDAADCDLRIEAIEKPRRDPVIEVYKRDIDRSLLRENLRKTPDERIRTLVEMDKLFQEGQRARAAKRKRG